jgi:hypothetical protein
MRRAKKHEKRREDLVRLALACSKWAGFRIGVAISFARIVRLQTPLGIFAIGASRKS